MNKHTLLLVAALVILLLPSCSSVLYTHAQVLDKYRTKSQVLQGFGVPSYRSGAQDYEEWTYDFGSVDVSRTRANAYNNYYGGVSGSSTTINQTYSRYLKFTFRGDQVLEWKSRGVDYTERVHDKKKTHALLIALGVIYAGLLSYGIASHQL